MSINWPTREEWTAKAEYSVRTACYPWQRVSSSPGDWLTGEELAEARALAVAVVKATRTALTRAGRGNERPGLNAEARRASREYADFDDLRFGWDRIVMTARSVDAAPGQVERLAELAAKMLGARDKAAEEAEAHARFRGDGAGFRALRYLATVLRCMADKAGESRG